MANKEQEVTLEIADPTAIRPARKESAVKKLLRQLQATGAPPLDGEEVLPPVLVGDGNYYWYPLAWTRWMVRWEKFKTFFLLCILLGLTMVLLIMMRRDSVQVALPRPSVELLLEANKFSTFDRNQVEGFLQFVIAAANQSSSEGMPSLPLLEGSIDPAAFLAIKQRQMVEVKGAGPADIPIYTVYISKFTRWRYDPGSRLVETYAQGFRMKNTLSGQAGMEPYRALITVFLEPTSNRNRWGYYVQKFEEYYGAAADTFDAELQSREKTGI